MPDNNPVNVQAANLAVSMGDSPPPLEPLVTPPATQAPSPQKPPQAVEEAPIATTQPGPVVTTTGSGGGKKKSSKKVIATILGIALLIGGVATGVFLVSQQQEIRIGAWDCSKYVFEVSQDGLVTARNGSLRDEPAQQARVYINGQLVYTFDVPILDSGDATTLGTVTIPSSGSFTWEVVGTKDCENSGRFDPQPTPTPTHIPTPTPTPPTEPSPTPTKVPTPTPTPPPIGAACLDVKAYDAGWNLLTPSDLTVLEAGDIVRFAVAGTTTSGSFDKVRFTINGTQRAEVTAKKPGSEEFYDEYSVPAGVTSFIISAQIHHTSLGWF